MNHIYRVDSVHMLTIPGGSLSDATKNIANCQSATGGIGGAIQPINACAFGVVLNAPGMNGVPPCGPTTGNASLTAACDYSESGFTTAPRNAFRGSFQTRFDFSVLKQTKLSERFNLKYTFDAFNLFNHPSFDTPNNNVSFFPYYYPGSYTGTPSGHLGVIEHSIGSPRFLQMSLHLQF